MTATDRVLTSETGDVDPFTAGRQGATLKIGRTSVEQPLLGQNNTCRSVWALWPDLGLIQVHQQRVQIQSVWQYVHPANGRSYVMTPNSPAYDTSVCQPLLLHASSLKTLASAGAPPAGLGDTELAFVVIGDLVPNLVATYAHAI